MSYILESVDIGHEYTNTMSLGNNRSVPSDPEMIVNCKIRIIDHSGFELHSIEDFEKFLRASVYDWATPDMIREALEEKYPERIL